MLHFKKKLTDAVRDDEGMTLLELLVVLVILTLIVGIAGPMVIRQFETAKSNTALIEVNRLKTDVEFFRVDVGRYPTSDEGLGVLLSSDAENWNGPYVEKAAMLVDPWGNDYLYTMVGGVPVISSLGADGAEGGSGEDADVRSDQ